MSKLELLAVYGTLKRGCGNHKYLSDSKFVGTGVTLEKFVLVVSVIPYCIPIDSAGEMRKYASPIHVEVYEVSAEKLERIDELEGHPFWYKRKKVDVKLENGKIVKTWFYIYPNRIQGKIISNGEGIASYDCKMSY